MRVIKKWWQQYARGQFKAPQQLMQAVNESETLPAQTDFKRFLGELEQNDPRAERLRASLSIFTREDILRQHERADWQHVDARVMMFAAKMVENARKLQIPLYVHCALRTPAEQLKLFNKGLTKARYPHAPHTRGCAIDIVHSIYHWNMTNQEWQFLEKLGRETERQINSTLPKAQKFQMTWGGNWKFYDPAHWELSNWRDIPWVKKSQIGQPVRKTPRKILRESALIK